MKSGALDPLTHDTFKWIRNRPTAAEREAMLGMPPQPKSAEIVARDYRSDKARIRRIGEKMCRLLAKPVDEQERLVSRWGLERMRTIPEEES